MCGIAGYSLDADSARRPDARGPGPPGRHRRAWRRRGRLRPQRRRLAGHDPQAAIGRDGPARCGRATRRNDRALVHVRDYTKGHPTVLANNHPIRHGSVVGDPQRDHRERRGDLRAPRHRPRRARDDRRLRGDLRPRARGRAGSRSARGTSRLDGDGLARRARARTGSTSPAASPARSGSGAARRELFFASTKAALEVVEGTLRLTLRKREVAEGRLLHLERGRITTETRFRADRTYRDDKPLPAVRAPHEGASCLAKLATLTA